ncbi:MAG: YlmH/Sll1252 family protein [Anaerovoracaceae bacterium]
MNEDKRITGLVEDKLLQHEEQYVFTCTGFLNLHERSLAEGVAKGRGAFYGGYEGAERVIFLCLPEYTTLEEEEPLCLLRVKKAQGSKALTHRDYLGSLVGLGINRSKIGDILVQEDGADIVILKEMGEFLLLHYDQAGRVPLKAELLPIAQLRVPVIRMEQVKDTVASLRLDNVIASAFSLSRAKAAEAIASGLVFVNKREQGKVDFKVNEGDELVLRGKGKVFLAEIAGRSRKDRVQIVIEQYK